MEIREERALESARLEEYFSELPDLLGTELGEYVFPGCRVRLTALPARALGPLKLPCTRVEFVGAEAETSALYRRFALRFLSAGG